MDYRRHHSLTTPIYQFKYFRRGAENVRILSLERRTDMGKSHVKLTETIPFQASDVVRLAFRTIMDALNLATPMGCDPASTYDCVVARILFLDRCTL